MGGLSVDTNDSGFLAFKSHLDDLKSYFSSFGEIDSASVMYHHDKRHSRGFGFVLFKSASSVNTVIRSSPHIIKGKTVDVKKAYPKDELPAQPAESLAEPEDPRPRRLSPAKSLRSRPHRDSLQLEFFDEEDNNPLPASYTQPSPEDPLSPLSRPTPRTLPLPRFSYEPLAQPTYPLYEEPFSPGLESRLPPLPKHPPLPAGRYASPTENLRLLLGRGSTLRFRGRIAFRHRLR